MRKNPLDGELNKVFDFLKIALRTVSVFHINIFKYGFLSIFLLFLFRPTLGKELNFYGKTFS
jgi:hypothetical protein